MGSICANLYNYPVATNIIVIKPVGPFYINGFSKKFSTKYDERLSSYLHQEEFENTIHEINVLVEYYWPCKASIIVGIIASVLTLGLSLLLPLICLKEAEYNLKEYLSELNIKWLKRKLEIRFVKGWIISWLEINIINDLEKFEDSALNGLNNV